jgi:hypothetical protein
MKIRQSPHPARSKDQKGKSYALASDEQGPAVSEGTPAVPFGNHAGDAVAVLSAAGEPALAAALEVRKWEATAKS